jgi:hypothetical protein
LRCGFPLFLSPTFYVPIISHRTRSLRWPCGRDLTSYISTGNLEDRLGIVEVGFGFHKGGDGAPESRILLAIGLKVFQVRFQAALFLPAPAKVAFDCLIQQLIDGATFDLAEVLQCRSFLRVNAQGKSKDKGEAREPRLCCVRNADSFIAGQLCPCRDCFPPYG